MAALIVILIILAAVEIVFSPRFDRTREGNLLLWFNMGHSRSHIRIF